MCRVWHWLTVRWSPVCLLNCWLDWLDWVDGYSMPTLRYNLFNAHKYIYRFVNQSNIRRRPNLVMRPTTMRQSKQGLHGCQWVSDAHNFFANRWSLIALWLKVNNEGNGLNVFYTQQNGLWPLLVFADMQDVENIAGLSPHNPIQCCAAEEL